MGPYSTSSSEDGYLCPWPRALRGPTLRTHACVPAVHSLPHRTAPNHPDTHAYLRSLYPSATLPSKYSPHRDRHPDLGGLTLTTQDTRVLSQERPCYNTYPMGKPITQYAHRKRILQRHGEELSRRVTRLAPPYDDVKKYPDDYHDYTLHVRHVSRKQKDTRGQETTRPLYDGSSCTDSDVTISNSTCNKSKTSPKKSSRRHSGASTRHGGTPRYLTSSVDPVYTDQLIQQVARMTQADTATPCDVTARSHTPADEYDVYAASSVSSFVPAARVEVKSPHGGWNLETREEEIDSLLFGRSKSLPCHQSSRPRDRQRVPKHAKRDHKAHSSKRHSQPTAAVQGHPKDAGHESSEFSRVRQFMSRIIDDLQKEGTFDLPQKTVTTPCPRLRKDSGIACDQQLEPSTCSPKKPGLPAMTSESQLSPDQLYDGSREGVVDLPSDGTQPPTSPVCLHPDDTSTPALDRDTVLKQAITKIVFDTMTYYHSKHPETCPLWGKPSDPEVTKADLDRSFDSTAYDSGHGSSAYSEFNDSFPDALAEVTIAGSLEGDDLGEEDVINDVEVAEPIYETIPEFLSVPELKQSCIPEVRHYDLYDPIDHVYERITDIPEDVSPPPPPALPARNYPRHDRPRSRHKDKRSRARDTPHYDDIVKDTDIVDMTSQHIYTVRDVLDSIARLAGDLPDEDEEVMAGVTKSKSKLGSSYSVGNLTDPPLRESHKHDFSRTDSNSHNNSRLPSRNFTSESRLSGGEPPRSSTLYTARSHSDNGRHPCPPDSHHPASHSDFPGSGLSSRSSPRSYPGSPESSPRGTPGDLWRAPHRHSVHYAVHDLVDAPPGGAMGSRPSSHYYSQPCPAPHSTSQESLVSGSSDASRQAVWSQAISTTMGTLC